MIDPTVRGDVAYLSGFGLLIVWDLQVVLVSACYASKINFLNTEDERNVLVYPSVASHWP
jgi:hypothetical protein